MSDIIRVPLSEVVDFIHVQPAEREVKLMQGFVTDVPGCVLVHFGLAKEWKFVCASATQWLGERPAASKLRTVVAQLTDMDSAFYLFDYVRLHTEISKKMRMADAFSTYGGLRSWLKPEYQRTAC